METQTISVQGMSCEACVGHVTRALLSLDGVRSAEVSLADAQATVTYDPAKVNAGEMRTAIKDEGYRAE